MKCMYCQGTMQRGFAPLHIDRNGYHLSFESVPAWVCTQCGETYIEEHEVDVIQTIIGTIDQKTSEFTAMPLSAAA